MTVLLSDQGLRKDVTPKQAMQHPAFAWQYFTIKLLPRGCGCYYAAGNSPLHLMMKSPPSPPRLAVARVQQLQF